MVAITLSDGAALSLLGSGAGAIVGRSIFELHRERPAVLDDFRVALAGNHVRSEVEQEGHIFAIAYDPILDADGRVTGVTGVAMDQTERRQAEAEVLTLNRELEARVEERTSQLNEANGSLLDAIEDLKKAQAKLVLSEKVAALGQLVASIAHQLNTPLGAISSSAAVMGKELSSGLLPFIEGYSELGREERDLVAELFDAASKKGPPLRSPRGAAAQEGNSGHPQERGRIRGGIPGGRPGSHSRRGAVYEAPAHCRDSPGRGAREFLPGHSHGPCALAGS